MNLSKEPAFTVPVYKGVVDGFEEINKVLAEDIARRAKSDVNVKKNTHGGWSSTKDLLDWPAAVQSGFTKTVHEVAKRVMLDHNLFDERTKNFDFNILLEAWANVLPKGGYHGVHLHSNCILSAVYYVQCGQPDADDLSGAFELVPPMPQASVTTPGVKGPQPFRIKPTPGLLFIFPSWLHHFVHLNRDDTPRMSIAINMRGNYVRKAPPEQEQPAAKQPAAKQRAAKQPAKRRTRKKTAA